MFGYIRPLQGELKVRELERFKACYCGLCHALGQKYGFAARFILNYELVFLAMLLWDEHDMPVIKRKRCVASPCRKKRYCAKNTALDTAAGYSVILSWWKTRDTIADEGFIKALPHRALSLILSGAYKKAAREFPEFDATVKRELAGLSGYELGGRAPSLDGAADKFAKILANAAPDSMPPSKRRPLTEILYHTGRWIYIIDACDDYKADALAGRYNPVAQRAKDGALPVEESDRLQTTLTHSNNLIRSAFELMPENAWTETVRNTIDLGTPDVCRRVLDGTWQGGRGRGGTLSKRNGII